MPEIPAPQLLLASTSTYRRRLLERLEIPFRCEAPDTDETPLPGEAPAALARRLAQAKAVAVSRAHPGYLVLGSDQTAAVDGVLLAKPGTATVARRQLRLCGGKTVTFHTAVALCRGGTVAAQHSVMTEVVFRPLDDDEIAAYVERDAPLDCAGSFRWEGLGISLFRALRSDDPTALEGLPLITVVDMLREQGVDVLRG